MNISKNNQWLVTGAKDTNIKFFDISNLENEIKEIILLEKAHDRYYFLKDNLNICKIKIFQHSMFNRFCYR